MPQLSYIACDLGASSGRVILGRLTDGKLALDEVHRFANEPVKLRGTLRWNVIQIFQELKAGLRKIAAAQETPMSLSVDSWGVDYVLLNAGDPMLRLPFHYRDARTDAAFARALSRAGRELIFAETGIQFMPLNTLYQLEAELEQNRALLETAEQFLNMADYFHFLFCGVGKVEESMASTTQLYNPTTRAWSAKLIETFNFPPQIFPAVVPSGTCLGRLLPELEEETGLRGVEVIATASHDTGAAVAAVPAHGEGWAFLSSGTWSLMGVELAAPLINEQVLAENFTNEIGYGGTTRFLKNIVGLWLLQECQRTWQRQGQDFALDELHRQTAQAEPFRSLIDPNAPLFVKPDQMPEKIAAFCRESNQPAPETPGQFVRCILESLALLYREVLGQIEQLTGRTITQLHVVGGGSKSRLLNQFAANATGCTVLAGPVEATAVGNILIQAITLRDVASLAEARAIVRASFPITTFQAQEKAEWERAFARFAQIDRKL